MNTIPSTFSSENTKWNVISGVSRDKENPSEDKFSLSLILLGRDIKYYRYQSFQSYVEMGFDEIICVEDSVDNYEMEEAIQKFPSIRFVVFQSSVSAGEKINVAMNMCSSNYAFIIWDDMKISKALKVSKLKEIISEFNVYCITPSLKNSKSIALPVQIMPEFISKDLLKFTPTRKTGDKVATIYPFDFVGIYNKEKFLSIGGFDFCIKNAYWQNVDLAFRSWLFGEETMASSLFSVNYEIEEIAENSTSDEYYLNFYLKNELPEFKNNMVRIPCWSFFKYNKMSVYSFSESLTRFKDAKRWVFEHSMRFKYDVNSLLVMWEKYI